MGSNSPFEYLQALKQLESYSNIPRDLVSFLRTYFLSIYRSDMQNKYSKPMPWIGIYIALASVICTLAMAADLFHGLKNKKLWFPCKYFTLNAASLSVMAVAVKLPMDLNNSMPGDVDQAAKLGSMAFMCTMMANSLPSLATMNNKELVTNIVALCVLVITLVVNVCIQIKTGVLSYSEDDKLAEFYNQDNLVLQNMNVNRSTAIIYMIMLLMLLLIEFSTALAILKSKHMLESKFQLCHKRALKTLELQHMGRLTVEQLKQHVSNYWIMAETGSPQFVTACSATTTASGIICVFGIMLFSISGYIRNHKSDYKWSIPVILVTQFIGVIVGTVAPVSRCFASLRFKMSIKWIWDHIKIFKVEGYWTQKLSDWKHSTMPLPFCSHRCKVVIENFKVLILSVCIGFQMTVVVACKMIALIPFFFVIFVLYFICCCKSLKAKFCALGSPLRRNPEPVEQNKDLQQYVLQLQDDMELAERTVKGILKSGNRLIEKAASKQPKNLINLLEASSGFEGVKKFDSNHVPPLTSEEYLNCWSLSLVTLTTIAISLPNIQSNIVDSLLSGVREGLVYVTLVEESLNVTDEYVIMQKAAKRLWLEIEVYHKWLGQKLQIPSPKANRAEPILQWFSDTAKTMVTEAESMGIGGQNDHSMSRSISANSMYRVTETIILFYQSNNLEVTQEDLWAELSSMISDILSACLTNLAQVISSKCYTSFIEKREESVHAAAQLLGETMEIINSLQDCELPQLNPDELAYIDRWHVYLTQSFP